MAIIPSSISTPRPGPCGSDAYPSLSISQFLRATPGGISQLKKIATLAETFFVPMAPHNTCSELGLTASLHLSASVPLFLIQEGYVDGHIMPPGVARRNWTIDKDGYASLPQGPGLGVEMDEALMAKVAADARRKFRWPKVTYPTDGSVRDY